jgi:translation initiation factor 2 gamma subunit (eIF-2gamma)
MLDSQEIPQILLENKCDLLGEDKYNEGFEELKKFANDNNINECYRTSALNGYNVNKAITFLINEIAKTFSEEDLKSMSDLNTSRIKLKNQNNQKKCCQTYTNGKNVGKTIQKIYH